MGGYMERSEAALEPETSLEHEELHDKEDVFDEHLFGGSNPFAGSARVKHPLPERPPAVQGEENRAVGPSKSRPSKKRRDILQRNHRPSLNKLHGAPELKTHHQLGPLKDKIFNELGLSIERVLAMDTRPELKQMSVPNRYLDNASRLRAGEENYIFPGDIEISGPLTAIRAAYGEHIASARDASRIVIWADGSSSPAGAGVGVAYRLTSLKNDRWTNWNSLGLQVKGNDIGSLEAEFLAVMKAIDTARDLFSREPGRYKATTIYTDSQSVLDHCNRRAEKPPVSAIFRKAMSLKQLGSDIKLRWCPGHSKVPGNELADKAAQRAASQLFRQDEEFIVLTDDEGYGTEPEPTPFSPTG
ncbi:RnaseH-domain-containing protein [Aaosphaeria arxii CBS 175.79]|uniref:ribonuclease H n=1 Tax=Aaosphaeria arxii CBS 175.79 TaxID=1450172 RepID=A0A6A5Y1A3_9PLEO|nr:RnaseH-domain-containing protein [Aaosphaeria arxii CBS 175.79]KAF2019039.1 RnaseH-domain-containing protein [Aaosphaeria arxii CBS 175.79]